jgi:hypothetical protein
MKLIILGTVRQLCLVARGDTTSVSCGGIRAARTIWAAAIISTWPDRGK